MKVSELIQMLSAPDIQTHDVIIKCLKCKAGLVPIDTLEIKYDNTYAVLINTIVIDTSRAL